MRVVGGRWRGRRLSGRLPPGVRPTSDRVREAIFDILSSLGILDGAAVADLFCGSGALGLEALSRGAASVVFVDRDPEALGAVSENLASLGAGAETARVVRAGLPGWLRGAPVVDLAFCDPPYAFAEWSALLDRLPARWAVLETGHPLELPEAWILSRSRRYGGTLVTVAQRPDLPSRDALGAGAAPVTSPRTARP